MTRDESFRRLRLRRTAQSEADVSEGGNIRYASLVAARSSATADSQSARGLCSCSLERNPPDPFAKNSVRFAGAVATLKAALPLAASLTPATTGGSCSQHRRLPRRYLDGAAHACAPGPMSRSSAARNLKTLDIFQPRDSRHPEPSPCFTRVVSSMPADQPEP